MQIKEKSLNITLHDAAAVHSRKRSEEVVKKIATAISAMDLEINENDGIYPQNGGKISQREICRRANIAYITLHSPIHKNTTRITVEDWLSTKKNKTKAQVHKAVINRVEHWKVEHQKVASQICVYELELKELKLRIEQLEIENETLTNQLRTLKKLKVTTLG